MSYLTMAAGIPDFSKAVISLWFRVPRESAVAAANHSLETEVEGFFMMQSILPLITFGKPQINKNYHGHHLHNVAVIHPSGIPGEPDPGTTYETNFFDDGPVYDVDPSYIGVVCFEDGIFRMIFNLQMNDFMPLDSTSYITTQVDIWSSADPAGPAAEASVLGSGVITIFPNVGETQIEEISHVDNDQPEFFTIQSSETFEPDRWHHVLLAFDVSGSVSIGHPFASSQCRLWYAIDDVDYRGPEHLQPYRDSGGLWGADDLDPNAILTRNAYRLSGFDPDAPVLYQNHFVPLPSGTYEPAPIPTDGHPIGIPAWSRYQDSIFRVEMGEFQMWTGVTLDTGVLANRRAFIDFRRDEDGNPVDDVLRPVNPTKGTEDDPRGPGERLLGKKPEILLHGSSKWKIGYNTGTTGVEIGSDDTLTKIPEGQFVPTAKIEPWKPDPSLDDGTA